MADVLNPERTESAHLNTELQTPTLDAPADHFDPSEDHTANPHADAPTVPHRVIDPKPVATHSGPEDTELTGMEDFAAALESFDREQAAVAAAQAYDDNVVTGTVIKLTDKHVVVDVGLKSEGLIPLEQVLDHTGQPKLKAGDTVEVVVEREEAEGGFLLSYDKAQRHRVWDAIERAANDKTPVVGTVFGTRQGRSHGRHRHQGVPAWFPAGNPASP